MPMDILAIPPGGAREMSRPAGVPATNGIGIAIVLGAANNDNTPLPGAGLVTGSVYTF